MQHLILVGACYVDTILSVPFYPGEDDKLRATALQVRRGGNCPNSLEVLQQLLAVGDDDSDDGDVQTYLVSTLPERGTSATAMVLGSFEPSGPSGPSGSSGRHAAPNCDLCLFRDGHTAPASSYIVRSAATGSRTIINYNGLPEMTAAEFAQAVDAFRLHVSSGVQREPKPTLKPTSTSTSTSKSHTGRSWWHFEGRIPDTTLACIQHLRSLPQAGDDAPLAPPVISVEVEKPGRAGLRALAAAADVVFYSRSWAEAKGYASAAACLEGEVASLPAAKLLFCTWGAEGAAALAGAGSHVLSSKAASVASGRVVDLLQSTTPRLTSSTVGAGDTFVAGILYRLVRGGWDSSADADAHADGINTVHEALAFAVDLATRKVQIDGFQGLV